MACLLVITTKNEFERSSSKIFAKNVLSRKFNVTISVGDSSVGCVRACVCYRSGLKGYSPLLAWCFWGCGRGCIPESSADFNLGNSHACELKVEQEFSLANLALKESLTDLLDYIL